MTNPPIKPVEWRNPWDCEAKRQQTEGEGMDKDEAHNVNPPIAEREEEMREARKWRDNDHKDRRYK